MKTFVLPLLGASLVTLAFSGCMISRPPVEATSQRRTTGQELAFMGGGAAAGGAAGYALDSNKTRGALIGAGAGMVAGAVVNNVLTNQRAQAELEAHQEGYRTGVMDVMNEYWDATRNPSESGGPSRQRPEVYYPAGSYDGRNYYPSTGTQAPTLSEPIRY